MGRWVNENMNPYGKNCGDCVVRAISKACGMSWDDAYIALTVQGYKDKDILSSNTVWGKYLQSIGFRRRVVADGFPDCYTVEQFCEDNPSGAYVLALQSHVVAAIDGQYIDSWDSGREPLIFYWERKAE